MRKPHTRVVTRERVDVQTQLRHAQLSDLEEQVVRMRHGLALAPEAALEQRQMPTAEVRQRVAEIERQAVGQLLNDKDLRRKQAIIDQLRDL